MKRKVVPGRKESGAKRNRQENRRRKRRQAEWSDDSMKRGWIFDDLVSQIKMSLIVLA